MLSELFIQLRFFSEKAHPYLFGASGTLFVPSINNIQKGELLGLTLLFLAFSLLFCCAGILGLYPPKNNCANEEVILLRQNKSAPLRIKEKLKALVFFLVGGLCGATLIYLIITPKQLNPPNLPNFVKATNFNICIAHQMPHEGEVMFNAKTEFLSYDFSNFKRIDIGVRDKNNKVWPQLRDGRVRPTSSTTWQEPITVKLQSDFPLEFTVLGLTESATNAFDDNCNPEVRECYIRLPKDGVTILSLPVHLKTVKTGKKC